MKNKSLKTTEQWQELHLQLQDMLAAYIDKQLDEKDTLRVEAHLAGCEMCRLDISQQVILSQKLSSLPIIRMSSTLHQRIDNSLNESLSSETLVNTADNLKNSTNTKTIFNWFSFKSHHNPIKSFQIFTTSGWSIAFILFIIMMLPYLKLKNKKEIPMIQDALTKYHYLSQNVLPVSLKDTSKDIPATWPDSHVLGTWKTTIAGAPAQAYAVRNGNAIIFQFKVDETTFFHNPDVRFAIANMGNYQVINNKLKVLALPLKKAGLIIVGPTTKMPKTDALILKSI